MNQQVESLTLNYYLIHKHRLYSWAYVFKKSYISKLLCWQNEHLATGEHNINYELTISNLKMSQHEVNLSGSKEAFEIPPVSYVR